MSKVHDLFAPAQTRQLGNVQVLFRQFPFEHLDAALAVGDLFQSLDLTHLDLSKIRELLGRDSPHRPLLLAVLACGISLPAQEGQPEQPLTADDVAAMPLLTVAEALAVMLEVNADFFSQTLPRLAAAGTRALSIGSALLSSLSAPVTASSPSAATP